MFMPNIPRRKIYEVMLEFEDGMIEMQILLYNRDNFEKFRESFYDEGYPKIRTSYKKIKVLMIMFLENRKYTSHEEFEKDLNHLKRNDENVKKHLWKSKNLPLKFKFLVLRIDYLMRKYPKINSLFIARILYRNFDKFNSQVPKILEIRRDHMK